MHTRCERVATDASAAATGVQRQIPAAKQILWPQRNDAGYSAALTLAFAVLSIHVAVRSYNVRSDVCAHDLLFLCLQVRMFS